MEKRPEKQLWFIDLGRCAYMPVWTFQKALQQLRIQQQIPDTLIFVEHPPVYTIGKNGSEDHVVATAPFLRRNGIEVIPVDRGGDVTYHGPGQLVGYPIFDLRQHRKSVSFYMRQLEAVFIESLKQWRLAGERNEGYAGVFVGEEKIVALGVRISRWVTMHGFALNVHPDLSHFDGIIPCGIFHLGVTSLEKCLGQAVTLETVKETVLDSFIDVFRFETVLMKTVDTAALLLSAHEAVKTLLDVKEMSLNSDQENLS